MPTKKKATKKPPKKTIEDVLFEINQLRIEIGEGLKDTATHATDQQRISELEMSLDQRKREVESLRTKFEEVREAERREAVYNFTDRLVSALLEWRMINLDDLEKSSLVRKDYQDMNGETKSYTNLKIPLIKALREVLPGFGLKQAKDLVDQWFSRTGRGA
jgi:ribosomal protein L7/L12